MSIYVKTKTGADPLQTPSLRVMKLNDTSDTLERADDSLTSIHSLTMKVRSISLGIYGTLI